MKKFLLLTIVVFLFMSCGKSEEEKKDLGKQAANEFCDCYKKSSENVCLERLKSNYDKDDYTSDDFISSFNEASTCGVQLKKIQTGSKSTSNSDISLIVLE